MKITQTTPATGFSEAFAIENGHMGAMIYGGIQRDVIELSENTFYSGIKSESDNQPQAAKAFEKGRGNYGTNLPVGQIVIEHGELKEDQEVSLYERCLNIEEGTTETQFNTDDSRFHTLAFASHPRKVICYEVTSEGKKMDLSISFQSFREEEPAVYQLGGIFFVCQAREEMDSEGTTGTLLCGKAVLYTDGFPQVLEDKLLVRNAHRMALYITSITDFREEPKNKQEQILALQMKMNRDFVKIEDLKFEGILEEHRKDMQELYGRAR